jgi:hypothetical protein
MKNTTLVITSIAGPDHPVLNIFARKSKEHNVPFIVIGDTKSPDGFHLEGCDFYSVDRQKSLGFSIAEILPVRHYARKNIGYLVAIKGGCEVIIETDDDNLPFDDFWKDRSRKAEAHSIDGKGWVNVYKYFSEANIWPRGFALENLLNALPEKGGIGTIESPIQQGLADENPDVDAIYRLILPLPLKFEKNSSVALGNGSICPFNSQNTTWFPEAFPLLYLPSFCSFRMTDIWRSFVAQRIAWTCGWPVLFHQSTVWQERNDHNLMTDFKDEISGYTNNLAIMQNLNNLPLKNGVENIGENMKLCYARLIEMGLVGDGEMPILEAWLRDLTAVSK